MSTGSAYESCTCTARTCEACESVINRVSAHQRDKQHTSVHHTLQPSVRVFSGDCCLGGMFSYSTARAGTCCKCSVEGLAAQ